MPLASATSSQPYNGALGKGTFSTSMAVFPHADYSCCTQVDAEFYLQLDGSKQEVEVGYLVAYVVNKAMRSNDKTQQLLWRTQLLKAEDDASELSIMMRTLYNRAGARRPGLTAFAEILSGDRVCHLDSFKLHAKYRSGKGIGPTAIESFHTMLPQLSGGYAYSGTVLLSPGTPADALEEYQEVDLAETEKKLMGFYGKHGYRLIGEATHGAEGAMTVMGRTV